MPEGPEVKLMTEKYNMTNLFLNNISFSKYSKYNNSNIKYFNKLMFPSKVIKHFNIGKEIFIQFKNYTIIINLGFAYLSKIKNKYTIITFQFKNYNIYINDMRKFSSFEILHNNYIHKYINNLGYDPLYYNINFNTFYNNFIIKYNSKQEIYKKLLDQRIFSGCGNYIRCELIYDSKISPFCSYNNLTKQNWKKIFISYNKITRNSYYLQKNNKYLLMKVYRRTDKNDVIRIVNNNRSFWYSKSINYIHC